MFADFDEDDIVRVGSPWDSLLSGSPSPVPTPPSSVEPDNELMRRLAENVPRLTPEIEEGNIEYKLRLINPSEERFARLVTQLKWRLGAGGGQAYYEIGVADSGQLVGLHRKELEQSLETLEMMAGEIGASVIIVKEIEVPAAMFELSAQTRQWIDLPKSTRSRKRGGAIARLPGAEIERSLSAGSQTGTETETTTTDAELDEEDEDRLDQESALVAVATTALSLRAPLSALPDDILLHPPYLHSHPERPTAQSSPSILPIDSGPDADIDAADADTEEPTFVIDLEINEVYKPRPTRRRTPQYPPGHHQGYGNGGARKGKGKGKKEGKNGKATRLAPAGPVDKATKAEMKRLERDQRRDTKRKELARIGVDDELSSASISASAGVSATAGIVAPVPINARVPIDRERDDGDAHYEDDDDVVGVQISPPSPKAYMDDDDEMDILRALDGSGGPRLIVEVLVVRKSSIEESYLQFGDFSLDV